MDKVEYINPSGNAFVQVSETQIINLNSIDRAFKQPNREIWVVFIGKLNPESFKDEEAKLIWEALTFLANPQLQPTIKKEIPQPQAEQKNKLSSDAKIEIGIDTTTYPPNYTWFIEDEGSYFTSLGLGKMTLQECMQSLIQFCEKFSEEGTNSITVKIEFR